MSAFLWGFLAALAVMVVGVVFDRLTGCNTAFLQGWWGSMAFDTVRCCVRKQVDA